MRLTTWAIALIAFAIINCATAQPIASLLAPNPIAVAITIGQWLMRDSQKVYYVRVESIASTPALARAEGFKLAVSQAVGTLIVTESEVKNEALVRKDVIQYSSGYVQDFKVLQESQVSSGTKTVMDVWVSDSKIADRLLYESKGEGAVEGIKASTQYQTILNEKANGDKLLAAVLNDFPARAFDVSIGKTQWRTIERKLEIYFPIAISWNPAYIDSLYEVLKTTRDGDNSLDQKYGKKYSSVVMIKQKSDFFKTYAAYSDAYKSTSIENAFTSANPMVLVGVLGEEGKAIYTQCIKLEHMRGGYYGDALVLGLYGEDRYEIPQGQFFAINPPDASVGIYGDYKLTKQIRLVVDGQNNIVAQMKTVEVKVVRSNDCKKY